MAPSGTTATRLLNRVTPGSVEDFRRKAHIRIAERIDPARARYKPLSLLRIEAKRVLEQFLELDYPTQTKPDREKLIEEVLGESITLGPLEELFRDETIKEILILAPQQVIVRKEESWLPVSVFFRDEQHLRSLLERMTEQGESLAVPPSPSCTFDVRLPNGFRVMAILPPVIMDNSPRAVLLRGMPVHTPAPTGVDSGSRSGQFRRDGTPVSVDGPRSGIVRRESPATNIALAPTPPTSQEPVGPRAPTGNTTFLTKSSSRPNQDLPNTSTTASTDPLSRYRARATNLMVAKLAAAGVYDLSALATLEMNKLVAAVVDDMNLDSKLDLTEAEKDRLTLEILAGMNR